MVIVLCNCPPGEARSIALALVREGLAACVNVIPAVTSFFTWEGKLEEAAESTLILKVPESNLEVLKERIHELHSYETIEILVLPVDVGRSDPDYVEWVRTFAR
jgi:periplasmic divalent cation tolerance protein